VGDVNKGSSHHKNLMTTTTMTIDMDNSFVFATKYMKWMVSHDGTNVAEHTSSV